MTIMRKSTGVVLATAAAAIFTSGCAEKGESVSSTLAQEGQQMQGAAESSASEAKKSTESATEVKVACFGVNECKGKSECATPENACKGLNSCKGKGYLYMSMQACEAAGGKVITPQM